MTNAFAVQMFATQLRLLLQQEGCLPNQLEELFRQRWGVPFSDDQEASLQAALIEVTGQSRHLEELRPASILRRKKDRWYLGPDALSASWEAYKSHLLSKPAWRGAIDSIDNTSTLIVNELLNPSGPIGRRQGLVLGYVQSGKTANMAATIAKAADAGYRLVIVLAGMTTSLRRQTQIRFDEDLTSLNREQWIWLTQHSHDFSLTRGLGLTLPEGQTQIMVIKKNAAVLRRLTEALKGMPSKLRLRMPTLIVDDECDQASLNTQAYKNSVSRINKQIRGLLDSELLAKVTYLGYTATPYANVLTAESGHDGTQDLYPADFIIKLPRPEAYFGVDRLFGDHPDSVDDTGDSDASGLPMIRIVHPDEQSALKPEIRSKRDEFEPLLVSSLREALDYFLLCLAVMRLRGLGGKPCCMLVHTTLYATCHNKLRRMIQSDWLMKVRSDLQDRPDVLLDRFRDIWVSESSALTPEMRQSLQDSQLPVEIESFDAIQHEIPAALESITTIVENGESDDFLDFADDKKRHAIVIGGNVLARGLTIEGLTVSYFVRASSQFDTLMQMGRWFGYRLGYSDLPRIWMTPDLNAAFMDLVVLENEIRSDITLMSEQNLTPREFSIRVPQMPGMALTARNKLMMENIDNCRISFRGQHQQMIGFPSEREFHNGNRRATEQFLEQCSGRSVPEVIERNGTVLFRDVPYEMVRLFLSRFDLHKESMKPIPAFISDEVDQGEKYIRTWNVAVVGESSTDVWKERRAIRFGGVDVQRISRRRIEQPIAPDPIYIKALMSADHVLLDLADQSREAIRNELAPHDWSGRKRRRTEELGPSQCPLLLIYILDKDSCGAEKSPPKLGKATRVPITHGLEGDAVDDHIIALGFVFPDESPGDTRPKKYLRLRLPQLNPDELGEEPDDEDLPEIEVDPEDRRPRGR